ncbi:MAG: hypothetical protein WCP45_09265 [Verrucomicrobiota bacterium]
MGADLYLPIPLARGCKVTLDRLPFYDSINYRKYEPGTNVKSFTMADSGAADATLQRTGAQCFANCFLIFETVVAFVCVCHLSIAAQVLTPMPALSAAVRGC